MKIVREKQTRVGIFTQIAMFVLFLSLFPHYNAPQFRQTYESHNKWIMSILVTFISPIFKFSFVERLNRVSLVVNQMLVQSGNPVSCKG